MRDSVFICYRRDDTRFAAGRLAGDLQDHFGPERVYRDVVSIEAARPWAEQIQRAIGKSAVVIVVIGSEWLAPDEKGNRRLDDPEDTLRTEVATALAQGVPVVPVLIEDARMPDRDELPEELKPLAGIHARRLADADWAHHFERLLEDLERSGMPPPGARWRRLLADRPVAAVGALAGSIAALAVALVALGVFDGNGGDGERNGPPPEGALPVVVDLERGGFFTRGFFTPKGFIVATQDTFEPGFTASWTAGGRDHEDEVELVEEGSAIQRWIALLRPVTEEGPRVDFPTRDAQTLEAGERIRGFYGPSRISPGRVRAVGADERIEPLGLVEDLLVTDKVSRRTGGLPILDRRQAMVAMAFAESEEQTLSVPIEDIMLQFPQAF
jgi:TIR domain